MSNEIKNKIIVTGDGPGQNLLLGNSFHVLEDESVSTYKTNKIGKFFEYLESKSVPAKSEINVFYDTETLRLVALNREIKHGIENIAECQLTKHPMLQTLKKYNPASMLIDEFEKFLNSSKSFLGFETRELMDKIRNLSIEKVISIERQKDQKGNFNYSIKSKTGKSDYEFPSHLEFVLNPIMEFPEEELILNFDLYFNWKVVSDYPDIQMIFEFENSEFEMTVRDRIDKIIEGSVENAWPDKQLFPGDLILIDKTDGWKYMENGIA